MKAFPLHEDQTETRDMEQRGMDLRDYFAAKALTTVVKEYASNSFDDMAIISYQIADAMMKARVA